MAPFNLVKQPNSPLAWNRILRVQTHTHTHRDKSSKTVQFVIQISLHFMFGDRPTDRFVLTNKSTNLRLPSGPGRRAPGTPSIPPPFCQMIQRVKLLFTPVHTLQRGVAGPRGGHVGRVLRAS